MKAGGADGTIRGGRREGGRQLHEPQCNAARLVGRGECHAAVIMSHDLRF